METHHGFPPFRIEHQIISFTKAEKRLVYEALSALGYTGAQCVIDEIIKQQQKTKEAKSKPKTK